MLKRKKTTAAHTGHEMNEVFPVRQIRVTNGCRYYQVDLGNLFFGKSGHKNFASAKKARAFAAKSRGKAADGGIKAMSVKQHILTANAPNEEIKTVEARNLQNDALEILKPFDVSLYEAACFYAEHHGSVEYINSTKALLEEFIAEYQAHLQRISDDQAQKTFTEEKEEPSLTAESVDNTVDEKVETLRFPDTRRGTLELLNPSDEEPHEIVDHIDNAEARVSPFIAETPMQVDFDEVKAERDEVQAVSLVNAGKSTSRVWKPPYIPKNVKTQKTYTPTDVKRIMKTARPELVPYLALGLFAGLRSAEILKLRWRDVDFEQAEIQVNVGQSKMNGRRTVHMQSNLGQYLVSFRGKAMEFVVPYKQETLQRWSRKLFKELEIKTIPLGAHHSFAMYHLASHALDETMEELGYTESAPLHRYYRGLTNRRREQAVKYFSIAPTSADLAEIIQFRKKDQQKAAA